MKRYALLAALCAVLGNAGAVHLYHESVYQAAWCDQMEGEEEYFLQDGSRIDCYITGTPDEPGYAVEVDFAEKWAEAVGQSQFYAVMTDTHPGIVLILEDPLADLRFVRRLKATTRLMCPQVKVWLVSPREVIHEGTSGFELCPTEDCP